MISIQFRVQKDIKKSNAMQRTEELVVRLQDSEKQREALEREVSDLRNRIAEMASGADTIKALSAELENMRLALGLVDLKGPGVTVLMEDSKRAAKPGDDPNAFLIHDDDVLRVINELRASGAEAISVNGQRVMARTEVRCVGPTISVNGVRLSPPIVIHAIGNADTMEAGLKMRGGVIDAVAVWGIEVKVKKETEVIVPAYKGSLKFEYAMPVKKAGDQ
ncbi:MAG TPA: DUF881 domain-containing protein [Firmicutes bacterium]|nr:DUF881 domain-containing protein [Bacillota bacterium]